MAGDALLAPEITRRLLERFIQRPPPGMTAPPELDDLTPRELEVLRLIADGRSNAEIAAALVLSEATVKTHVNHILTKLRLRDRVQAVALAYRTRPHGDVIVSVTDESWKTSWSDATRRVAWIGSSPVPGLRA